MFLQEITGEEEHPALVGLDPEHPRYAELKELRREILCREVLDPFRYGYELPIWKLADDWRRKKREQYPKGVVTEINLGGNRSSKSERAAKRIVQAAVTKPGTMYWCCDSTEETSRANQQRLIEKYLPIEWKPDATGQLGRKKSKVTKVKYSIAGGFTENMLVLPNESQIFFKFYKMDVKSLEGPPIHGCWSDELIPLEWVETITFRLTNFNGTHHITFTPKEGWTPVVGMFLDGARTLVSEDADPELLPLFDDEGEYKGAEKVKRVVQPTDQKSVLIYFYTSDNAVYGNWEGMKSDLKGKPRSGRHGKLIRAYGQVDKAAYAQFPLFNDELHIVSEQKAKEWMKESDEDKSPRFERYQFVDPCPGRNWFMLWVACFPTGHKLVYREWPSFGHPGAYIKGVGDAGPWAIAGDAHDGVRGEAQEAFGFGLQAYKQEILDKEDGETIVERWFDARYANAPQQEREGTTTLIEQMSELDMHFIAATAERKILDTNDGSIDLINTLLYYDQDTPIGQFSASLARINEPMLHVSELCPNTIYSLKNWTGKDGQKGASKDPVDCLRMMVLSNVGYVGKDAYAWKR